VNRLGLNEDPEVAALTAPTLADAVGVECSSGDAALFALHRGNVSDAYENWPAPTTIVSDGAYGVGGFSGDPRTPDELVEWYRPHVEAWSRHAEPSTTLWFWNTEVGWATVHPLLVEHGWCYEFANVWDKGIAHIAGNVNGQTIRRLPVVSEICVFYSRRLVLSTEDETLEVQQWMRHEWERSGLPLYLANEACGVKNAATRKYLTTDWLWYFPPPDMMERLAKYANDHGEQTTRPYFSLDGSTPITAEEWAALRYKWNHRHGVTNVWSHPPLNGTERYKGNGVRSAPRVYKPTASSASHLNQKPLELMRLALEASTDEGDIVWEPFGGLCSAAVAAVELGRRPYAAESVPEFAALAEQRLRETCWVVGASQ